MESDQPAAIVALEAGKICGFATTGPSREGDCGELLALYVDPDRWGLGVGRALMRMPRPGWPGEDSRRQA